MIKHKADTYDLHMAQEETRIMHKYQRIQVLTKLVRRISSRALEYIYKEYLAASDALKDPRHDLGNCQDEFAQQYGLPCRHKLLSQLQACEPLELVQVDPHWWLRRDSVHYRVKKPLVIVFYLLTFI